MRSTAQASCTMTSSELNKVSHEHLAFTERLLESVRARRATEAQDADHLEACASDPTATSCSFQRQSALAWIFQLESA